MQILQNVPLSLYSTMRLGGKTAYAVDIRTIDELNQAIDWADHKKLPTIMIGNGSNIVWRDEGYVGLLLINKIKGYESVAKDDKNIYLTIGAGENWDSVVKRSVQAGLSGIEALSLIPGTAGATPVQNVGAYGQEISQTLVNVKAYDTKDKKFVVLNAKDCAFDYRTSRFKTTDRGRFYITGLTLHLVKTTLRPPLYQLLQKYFENHQISDYSPLKIRSAVIAIRRARLPDPEQIANNGSFFANPIVDASKFKQLLKKYPTISSWEQPHEQYKISAAWLVEQAGFKDVHDEETGMATWPNQPLVIINEHAKTTADLLKFKEKIVDATQKKFEVTLLQEPEFLP